MKKLIIAVAITLLVAFGGYIYHTKPCFAGICIGMCTSSSFCGDGCFCGKKMGEAMGECYSSGRADQLIKQGWERLP